MDLRSKILFGALVGDALGVPFEFRAPKDIPSRGAIEMNMAGLEGFRKTYPRVPYGVWSDEGGHILCLLESLLGTDGYDEPDFVGRLRQWEQDGHHQAGGRVFDIGVQTARALRLHREGRSLEVLDAPEHNGSGSLMRAIAVPLAGLALDWTFETIVRTAALQSGATHPHAVSRACCALYAGLVHELAITGASRLDLARVKALDQRLVAALPELQVAIDHVFCWHGPDTGGSYVLDSLWSAIHCVAKTDPHLAGAPEYAFANAVRSAIALGNDTDTTACLAGGLAGALWAIPKDWMDQLVVPKESWILVGRLQKAAKTPTV